MKRTTIFNIYLWTMILGLLCLSACEFDGPNGFTSQNPRNILGTTVIEGCQYFDVKGYGCVTYTHKGNCTNSIHLYTETMKKLMEYEATFPHRRLP